LLVRGAAVPVTPVNAIKGLVLLWKNGFPSPFCHGGLKMAAKIHYFNKQSKCFFCND
jgi:hypothetical protein